jgi:hypothetical protein
MIKHVSANEDESHVAEVDAGSQPATSQDQSLANGGSNKKQEGVEKKNIESMSVHSQLSSSLMETSEDEEKKRKEVEA